MSFGGGGFFGSGASSSESFGGALSKGDNIGTQTAGNDIVLNIQDNRQASGKYATIGGEGVGPDTVNIMQTDFGAIEGGLMVAAGALELSTGVVNNVVEEVFNTVDQQIASADAARNNAFEFAAGAIQNNTAYAQELNAASLKFGGDALAVVDESLNAALVQNKSVMDDAFAFAAGSLESLIGLATDNTAALAQAQAESIEVISSAARSDTAENFDKLIKVAAGALVGVVAIAYISQMRA